MRRAIPLALLILVALAGLALSSAATRAPRASAGGCEQSYAALSGAISGHWQGMWQNTTFQSNGALSVDVTVNQDCSASLTVTGIFMLAGPRTVAATYDDTDGTTITVTNHPTFGSGKIIISESGAVSVSGTGAHLDIKSYTGSGQLSEDHLNIAMTYTFSNDSTANENIALTRMAELIQGDVDCDGEVDGFDFELLITFAAELHGGQQSAPCPDFGEPEQTSDHRWGDVNCDGEVDALDSLFIIAYLAGVEFPSGHVTCVPVGEPFPFT